MFTLPGIILVIVLYSVTVFGAVYGASQVYDSTGPQDAVIDESDFPQFTAEDLNEPPSEMERNFADRAFYSLEDKLPWELATGGNEMPAWYNNILLSFLNGMMDWTVVVAKASASFFSANQWIPLWSVKLMGKIATLPVYGLLGFGIYLKVKQFR